MIDELLRETNGEECADESKRSDFRSDPIYSSSETGKGTGERDTERSRFRTGVKAEFSLFTMELRLEEMEFRRLEKKSLSIEASTSDMHSLGDTVTISLLQASLSSLWSKCTGRVKERFSSMLKSLLCKTGSLRLPSIPYEELDAQEYRWRKGV